MLILVAPYVGAWIETRNALGMHQIRESHPTWVRGLKHLIKTDFRLIVVAPYVGAWIETF